MCGGKWIDAAQQLPDNECTVLMALDNGEVWCGYHEAGLWHDVSAIDEEGFEGRITHWMHLPEPPARG